jgi:hypothetical protein
MDATLLTHIMPLKTWLGSVAKMLPSGHISFDLIVNNCQNEFPHLQLGA